MIALFALLLFGLPAFAVAGSTFSLSAIVGSLLMFFTLEKWTKSADLTGLFFWVLELFF
jgi:hypothetical protein